MVGTLISIKGHTLDKYKPKRGYYSSRIINGTSFVPLRAIAEAYQWDINYISKSKEIIIKDKDNNTISLKVGSKKVKKNNKNINLNLSPYIYNGHTYVPFRFVSESLGIKVYWDAKSKSILIGESDKANLNHPTINIMDDKFTISIDPKYYDQIIFNKEKI